MLRTLLLFLGIGLLFSSCGKDPLVDIRKTTTELNISLLDTSGTALKNIILTEKEDIKSVLSGISSAEAPAYSCGHNYELHCKTIDGNFFVIELNSDEVCASATFIYEDQLNYRYLNDEGVTYLNKLFEI